MGSFLDGLKKNIDKTLSDTNKACNEIAETTFKITVGISPTQPFAKYAQGQFINNWFPAVNGYDGSITGALSFDGADSRARIDSIVPNATAFFGKDGFISMSNNLSYAYNVEVTGWKTVGPYAPVRNTITFMVGKYSKQ